MVPVLPADTWNPPPAWLCSIEEWIEATDSLATHVNNANEFAYTATFGEYNPGGGKDQVEKYLEFSRKEMELVSTDLKKVLDLLSLSP
mmetsp:Transcript_6936/g.16995  ORF Transcript_6936/g.16995 Transcript_6936/m.16995 type:complete len:88 (+) Transcript_6936:515-778(+)